MKISAPIFALKRSAKTLSREQQIPLNQALDRVANQEGFSSWSLLAARYATLEKSGRIYAQLKPGTLAVVAARPGQGKTLLCLELAIEAMKFGASSRFFSLEYTEHDCRRLLDSLGRTPEEFGNLFEFDGSDAICADYIASKLVSSPRGTFVVIDYLQLLDQKRNTPELSAQIQTLHAFAHRSGVTMVFISQIDRHFNASQKGIPDLNDLRLPNPLNLKLFDKVCFLHNGHVRCASPK